VNLIIGVIFLVLFALVLVTVSLGYQFLERQRKRQVAGMLTMVSGPEGAVPDTTILRERAPENPMELLLQQVRMGATVQSYIQQAGLNWTVARFVVASAIGAVAGLALGWYLRPLGFLSLSMLMGAAGLGALPYLYLKFKRAQRMDEVESQLPEALDFLARSMRAGHAFSISLEMIGEELPNPLGLEFRTLFNELNLGAPVETALANFAHRIPLLDVRMFVSAVMLQKQTGGNLSEILIRLAYVIRERFRLKGQVRAASAHGRLTSAVLTCLPVMLIIAMLFVAPGYLQGMAADPDGKWMILAAVVAQGLGYVVMRRITNIKV
jgi:tight adherence protein B